MHCKSKICLPLVGLAGLMQVMLLLSLALPSRAQQSIETAKENEKSEQQVEKIEGAADKAKLEEEEAAEKANLKAEEAAEKAKLKAEEAAAAWRRRHPTPPSPEPAPSPTPPSPAPPSGSVYFPDYLTSPRVLLPSTYYTKRNAYKSSNWYLCPKPGHGSGTKANPFCLDDLPTLISYNSFASGSKIMSTMKSGDTLAVLPGTYNMTVGTPLSYILAVPAGTPSNYTVVTAADPDNPPVLVGGGYYFIGNPMWWLFPETSANLNLQGGSCTIYENLIIQETVSRGGGVLLCGNHAVMRNCDIEGNQSTNYNNDNDYCIEVGEAQRCQIYDNVIHDNTPKAPSGSTNYGNSSAIGLYDCLYLDVFHNKLYNNNNGTFNKDSGGGWGSNYQYYIDNGYILPAPYSDLNAYRANLYQNGVYGELEGTNQGPNDTIYVRDNVFAAGTADMNHSAVYTNQSYQIVFKNNLSLMPGDIGVAYLPFYTYFSNNITWSPSSSIVPVWNGSLKELQFMDNNVYLGPTGTTPFTVKDFYSGQTLDLQQMKQYRYELHSSVYSNPSQVFSNQSKYTLQPRFLSAASDGGAVGPRVPIDYISNPAWYGPNARLNPYGLSVSKAP